MMIKNTLSLLILVLLLATAVQAQNSAPATVIPFELNVRSEPSARGSVLGVFKQSANITLTGREDQGGNGGIWVYATDGTLTGWVLSDYVKFTSGGLGSLPILDLPETASSPAPAGEGTPAAPAPVASAGISGTTTAILNFRSGPATSFPVLAMLPNATRVTVLGRNDSGTWLNISANGQNGWVAAQYIRVSGSKDAIPVSGGGNNENSAPPPAAPAATGENWNVVSGIGSRVREIYRAGQQLGNRRNVFSKIGDSITASSRFLTPIGNGGAALNNYAHLQAVINFYTQTTARTHNSFANSSLAAGNGWTSGDLLNAERNLSPGCGGMTPLVCEYTLTKPAVALIMIGTNDAGFGVNPETFRANLQTIVQTSIDMGVIPVLSTIPNHQGAQDRIGQFNSIIASTAQAYQVPLWDYAALMISLPNAGLSADGIHPSSGSPETGVFADSELKYGYTIRNLTALMVLDTLWRNVLS